MNPRSDQPCLLITGVGRRIGAHLAAHFLERGFRVIGSYRKETPALRSMVERGLEAVRCELTDHDDVSHLIEQVRKRTSALRAIIHNASVWHTDAEIALTPAKADELFTVHVMAPQRITEALSALFCRDGEVSNVIFITDANIPHGKPDRMLYLASKAAAESMVRSMAKRYAPQARVNAVAPGLILFHQHDDDNYRQRRLSKRLLKFEPGPAVISRSVDYILDCPYLTGSVITVDGGKF
ncbi:MAG TPA: dihydromonapterin reductase [Halothiobacillus sp.]|nr:dihydromonapterin reductase [Halothiobacillus sp.]